eukprot:3106222-Prymnesium_polylepis.2
MAAGQAAVTEACFLSVDGHKFQYGRYEETREPTGCHVVPYIRTSRGLDDRGVSSRHSCTDRSEW